MSKEFTTELKKHLISNDFFNLRTLYTPIIGTEAVALFCALYDFNELNKFNKTYFPLKDLSNSLNISIDKLIINRKKLEAVGLIRVFEKADNRHFIFCINKPLTPNEFKGNSLLFKDTISKIGEIAFERIFFSSINNELSKEDFKEITIKYQDIFEFKKSNNMSTTREIPLNSSKSIHEAISGFNSQQFISFLTNENLTPSQIGVIQRLMNLGFSSIAINHIIHYCYEKNNKVVSNYIDVIGNDFFKRNISSIEAVKEELLNIKNNKKIKRKKHENISGESKLNNNDSWDDLISAIGGL